MNLKYEAHEALIDFANELILGVASDDDAQEILNFINNFQFDSSPGQDIEQFELDLISEEDTKSE